MGLSVLKTPLNAPQANAFCERLIGTIRRECLVDFIIAMSERHVRAILRAWVTHYDRGRRHASLDQGCRRSLGDSHRGSTGDRLPAGY